MTSGRPTPLAPPATVGVLGGGPYACSTVVAARTMGYAVVVLDPDPADPAGRVASRHIVAELDDTDALTELGTACDMVTIGHPDVAGVAMRTLAAHTAVHPSAEVVEACATADATTAFLRSIGAPLVVDTLDAASVDRRLSLTLARTADGRSACYAVSEDHHRDDVLDVSVVPASLGRGGQAAAERLCTSLAERLGMVGVLTVEMVVVGRTVLVHRLVPCPTVHGLWTLDACQTSQFAQHVRAVCGLGLGDPHLVVPAVATSHLALDPTAAPNWAKVLHHDTAHLHLYSDAGTDASDGRPVGHLTVTSGTAPVAANLARRLRSLATGR